MNLSKLILPLALLTTLAPLARAQPTNFPPSGRESIEWCDIWISHANETNLPRVLLIGDSIARAYYPEVEKKLAGDAYVARLATSRFISDPVLLQEIALVLDNNQFDIIHFNNGLHGFQHTDEEYRKAFPAFLATIKTHAPRSKLIWATSTTFRESKVPVSGDQTQAPDARSATRNAIALEYIQKDNIDVDDLYTLCKDHPEYHTDNAHFNNQGIELQSTQVAAHIKQFLKP